MPHNCVHNLERSAAERGHSLQLAITPKSRMTLCAFLANVGLNAKSDHGLGRARDVCKGKVASRVAVTSAPCRVAMISSTPVKEKVVKEVDVERERKTKPPEMYRLFIYNDPFNTRERVIDVLLKTCQELSFSRAYAAMQEAHENGRGLVVVVIREIAEHYCATINTGRLTAFGLLQNYFNRNRLCGTVLTKITLLVSSRRLEHNRTRRLSRRYLCTVLQMTHKALLQRKPVFCAQSSLIV